MPDLSSLVRRVAGAMGPAATPAQVEAVSRALLDEMLARPHIAPADHEGDRDRIVACIVGADGPELASLISDVLTDAGCCVLGVRSLRGTQGQLIVHVDAAETDLSLSDLGRRVDTVASRFGARAGVQHEALFLALNRFPL